MTKILLDLVSILNNTKASISLKDNLMKTKKTHTLIISSLLFLTCSVFAQAPGSRDTGFNPGIGPDNFVYSNALQMDGKIIIAGSFTSYNGTACSGIARINADGSLDATFNSGTGANDVVYSIAMQSDGKILLCGSFTTYNGTARNGIARINADGSLDNTFIPGTGADDAVKAITLQNNGKIFIVGDFTTYNGTSRNHIARINSDGTLDATFNPGTGATGQYFSEVNSIAMQTDGKVIIGGNFETYNGTSRNNIARINADGTLDASFKPGTGVRGTVHTIAVQRDGKALIGGFFTSYNGTDRYHIARINTNGSLDDTFNTGMSVNGIVYTITIKADGKIIFGGRFSRYSGTDRFCITRINTNGSLDDTFDPGTGTNNTVRTITLQADGKALIGGFFTEYDGFEINCFTRIN